MVLIVASIIAVMAARVRIVANLPPDVSLIIFLPALLFEGSVKIRLHQLRESLLPICLLATVGILTATLIAGFAVHWTLGIPIFEGNFKSEGAMERTRTLDKASIRLQAPLERDACMDGL